MMNSSVALQTRDLTHERLLVPAYSRLCVTAVLSSSLEVSAENQAHDKQIHFALKEFAEVCERILYKNGR